LYYTYYPNNITKFLGKSMPFIYLIHVRACVNSGESVFKLGKTIDFSKRIDGYDKGSIPLLSIFVRECDVFERVLIQMFAAKYKQRRDYGIEYFEGNAMSMISDIVEAVRIRQEDLAYTPALQPTAKCLESDNTALIVKTRTKLINKLNKVNRENFNMFQDNIIAASREFILCPAFHNLNSWIYDLKSQSGIEKKKLGDLLESKYGFVNNICVSAITHNNELDKKLIEHIMISV